MSRTLRLVLLFLLLFATGITAMGLGLSTMYSVLGGSYSKNQVKAKLEQIPNVKIISLEPTSSAGFYRTTIMVEGKGVMTFSGWSLHLDQFEQSNQRPIGLSQIGDCTVVARTAEISNTDSKSTNSVWPARSYRQFVVLHEEIDGAITTVQQAVSSYDLIYEIIHSWPTDNGGQGLFSNCE